MEEDYITDEILYQPQVVQLRAGDCIRILQNGREKWMMVSAITDAMQEKIRTEVPAMAVTPHRHAQQEVTDLPDKLDEFDRVISDVVKMTTELSTEVITTKGKVEQTATRTEALLDVVNNKATKEHKQDVETISNNLVDATQGTAISLDGCFPLVVRATVFNGVAVFHLTKDGSPEGEAIFPRGPIYGAEVFRTVADTELIAIGASVWLNDNKILSVPVSISYAQGAKRSSNDILVFATIWGR